MQRSPSPAGILNSTESAISVSSSPSDAEHGAHAQRRGWVRQGPVRTGRPYYKNFYAGGAGSVRGYDTASLGPYEISPTTGNEVRLGGTSRVVFNAELSMPLYGFGVDKSVRWGPFFDAGQVYADSNTKTGTCSVAGGICDQGSDRICSRFQV